MQQIDGNIALLLSVGLGLLLGLVLQWWRFRNSVSKQEMQEAFVRKEIYEQTQMQADLLQDDLREKETLLRAAESQAAVGLAQLEHLRESIAEQENFV